MNILLEAKALTKVFEDKKRGKIRAVDNLSFSVQRGEIFGLLGTNGAGKTTTLRILATILRPTSGTAIVAGHDAVTQPDLVRASIGYLTGDTNLYTRLTPREVLSYYARLFGMEKEQISRTIDELSERFDLGEFIDTKIGKLSTGQRQRTSICRAIIQKPDLMIFDEPTAGLDPISARHIVEFIRECRTAGRTVIFSTHYLREAEKLCDRIAIVHDGTLRALGTLEELLTKSNTTDLEDAFFHYIEVDKEPMNMVV